MTILRSRAAASLAAVAALAFTATPALAHGRGDWQRHHRHGGGIDGGDVLAGLLIIGGVAAIATAASKADRKDARGGDDGTYIPPYPGGPVGDDGYMADGPEDGGPGAYPGGPGGASLSGFDGAVDACRGEIERGDRRIGSVDNVRRMGERYSVEGALEDGRGYACSVDDAGRIRSVAVDGHAMI